MDRGLVRQTVHGRGRINMGDRAILCIRKDMLMLLVFRKSRFLYISSG
jgi:hypothetical protein